MHIHLQDRDAVRFELPRTKSSRIEAGYVRRECVPVERQGELSYLALRAAVPQRAHHEEHRLRTRVTYAESPNRIECRRDYRECGPRRSSHKTGRWHTAT